MAGAIYFVHGEIDLDQRPWRISHAVIAHGSMLLGLYFAVKAWSYALDRYLLLYNDNGVVVGAGYTDIHVELPILWLLICLAATAAVIAWANLWPRTYRLAIVAAALVFGSSFFFAELLPGLFQRFFVKPSELQLEAAVHSAEHRPDPGSVQASADHGETIPRGRGAEFPVTTGQPWDHRKHPVVGLATADGHLRATAGDPHLLQFLDVDVDRYQIDGSYQQVTLAARELAPSLLSTNAQTWVNLHLLFTHGNGIVMSPVTQKSAEGLPNFYLKDIPPIASAAPGITEPRIYFGEGAGGYVIVNGSTPEFDYPKGKDNVYANYDGVDGIAIGEAGWRALFAWHFDDVNILLSRYITTASRIMLHRNIQDRVQTIAPFLQLDRDPYVVISDGRLYWIQDAYTKSGWFPYAQPQPDGDTNYIRNSVKVVIDAYNGTVVFYVADASRPDHRDLPAHIRRAVQADRCDAAGAAKTHPLSGGPVSHPGTAVPRLPHGHARSLLQSRGSLAISPRADRSRRPQYRPGRRMAPYYIMMRLPGEPRAEFFLMLPMVPSQRENMIAWLAARCDLPDYGKLVVYEFPKDKLVYGPFQIEARINQNTEISQQISLWNQDGFTRHSRESAGDR